MNEKLHRLLHSPAAGDLWRWAGPCRGTLAAVCCLEVLFAACTLAITLGTRGLIDAAAAQQMRPLLAYAGVLAAAMLLKRGLALAMNLLSVRANAALHQSLRSQLLHALLQKQYAGLAAFHSGELVSRMGSDVQVVKNGILEILPNFVCMAVSFCGAVILLAGMDWRFAAALVACGLLGLALTAVLEQPLKRRHTAVQQAEAAYHAALQETLENLLVVKAGGAGPYMEQRVGGRQRQLAAAQRSKGRFAAWMNQGITLAFQLSWLLCLLWGGVGICRGTFTYGMLAAMLQLVNQVQGPISGMAGLAGQAYAAVSSAERLRELLALPDEPPPPALPAGPFAALRLQNVCFGYGRGAAPVLHMASCTIRAGDFVAVTGISGEGKSTLFRLLLGVYPPDRGRLELCTAPPGQPEQAVPVGAATRGMFAYVPQGSSLFSGTLRENLALFAPRASDRQLLEAARTACLDAGAAALPNGLDTVLGEHGLGVSEGQAQRIAVARAILTDAPVLLLDESTSALDEPTEAQLLRNLARLPGKTCLIVTHRRAALELCDYCLYIEQGTLTVRPPPRAGKPAFVQDPGP